MQEEEKQPECLEEIEKAPKDEFPSLNRVYDIAVQSYDLAAKRLDAVRQTTDRLLITGAGITFAVVTVATKDADPELGLPFWVAIGFFVCALILAFINHARGFLVMTDIDNLANDEWLVLADGKFEKCVIEDAGENYRANRKLVNAIGTRNNLIIAFIGLEVLTLAFWQFFPDAIICLSS